MTQLPEKGRKERRRTASDKRRVAECPNWANILKTIVWVHSQKTLRKKLTWRSVTRLEILCAKPIWYIIFLDFMLCIDIYITMHWCFLLVHVILENVWVCTAYLPSEDICQPKNRKSHCQPSTLDLVVCDCYLVKESSGGWHRGQGTWQRQL